MIKIFVLVVMFHVDGGANISFQEFTSFEQCQYAVSLIKQRAGHVTYENRYDAFCLAK
jgi:hypothetical protein